MFKINYVYASTFTANILGFLAGISLGWTSPIIPKLQKNSTEDHFFENAATDEEISWISALLSLGAIFGSIIFAALSHNYGRKISILCIGIPYTIGYCLFAFVKNLYVFMVARFITGLSAGGTFMVLSGYIGEICHDHHRGALTASSTSFILLGILFAYATGPFVSIMTFNLINTIISALFIPLFFLIAPESPYYLLSVDRINEALTCLTKLRGKRNPEISKELQEIETNIKKCEGGSFGEIFHSLAGLRALFILTTLVSLQQFSGINLILQYSQEIFELSNTSIKPEICPIIVGGVQFCTCYITPLLSDRTGRRILLFVSVTGAFLSLLILGLYFYIKDKNVNIDGIHWLPLLCLVTYIAFFNVGLAALPWALMGELFPMNVKAFGCSIATGTYWLFGFLLTKYFDSLQKSIGPGQSFWIFAGFCIIIDIFVFFFVFETKGKSLEEIQTILRQRHKI